MIETKITIEPGNDIVKEQNSNKKNVKLQFSGTKKELFRIVKYMNFVSSRLDAVYVDEAVINPETVNVELSGHIVK